MKIVKSVKYYKQLSNTFSCLTIPVIIIEFLSIIKIINTFRSAFIVICVISNVLMVVCVILSIHYKKLYIVAIRENEVMQAIKENKPMIVIEELLNNNGIEYHKLEKEERGGFFYIDDSISKK